MSVLLRTENLTRYYGKHCAVSGIGFSIERGEVLGFLGPNGAGKTTTLNMISGNLAPTSGRILIDGIDLASRPQLAKGLLGYLPDVPPLYADSTVDEYLLFCGKIHRISGGRLRQSLDRVKTRCGLTEVGNRLISNLSKGFQQRVGIAQAILHSPPLIILDEPSIGLDPNQMREIRDLIRELGEDHGVILSSHILSEVQSICTRTLIIHQGRLVLDTDMSGLEQSLERSSLVLKTRFPMRSESLERLNGVESLELLSERKYRIFFRKNDNPAEFIAETVVSGGWGLVELYTEHRTVEDLFVQLTDQNRGTVEQGSGR